MMDCLQGFDNDHIMQMHRVYDVACTSSDHRLHSAGFNSLFGIDQSTFSDLLFSKFACKQSESICFLGFLSVAWSFLSFPTHMIGAYIFFLFDQGNSGVLCLRQTRSMVRLIMKMHQDMCKSEAISFSYDSRRVLSKSTHGLLHNTNTEEHRHMTLSRFTSWSKSHQDALLSLEMIQVNAQERLLSVNFWKKLMQGRRDQDKNGIYVIYVAMTKLIKSMNEQELENVYGNKNDSNSSPSSRANKTAVLPTLAQVGQEYNQADCEDDSIHWPSDFKFEDECRRDSHGSVGRGSSTFHEDVTTRSASGCDPISRLSDSDISVSREHRNSVDSHNSSHRYVLPH
jgi:hypothetical protein